MRCRPLIVVRKDASVLSMLCPVCGQSRRGNHEACISLGKQKRVERERYAEVIAGLKERERRQMLERYDAAKTFAEAIDWLERTRSIVGRDNHEAESLLFAIIMGFKVASPGHADEASDI